MLEVQRSKLYDKTSAFDKDKCIDPTNFGKIYVAVFKAADENSELSPEVKRHLALCSYCREQIPTWQEIVRGLHFQAFLNGIVNDGLANRANILKRKDGNLLYFFGRPPGDSSGGYIVVWDEESSFIRYAEYTNVERFQEFSFEKDGRVDRTAG